MKKILAFLLFGIISLCFSQNNKIYYNKVSTEIAGYFSIWRIDENGENETLVSEQGYLLDISDNGEYILLSQFGYLALLNTESGILDGLGIQSNSAKFTSTSSLIVYATQTDLFLFDSETNQSLLISNNLSYESNFYHSSTYGLIFFYEQNNICKYDINNQEKTILSDNGQSAGGDGISYLSCSESGFIYYECNGIVNGYDGVPQICRVNYNGESPAEQITNELLFLFAPISNHSLQEKIAISSIDEEEVGSAIQLFDSETGNFENLTNLEGTFVVSKTWSKDSNHLYLSSYSDDFDFESYKIWKYDLLNETLEQFLNGTNPILHQNEELDIKNRILNKFSIYQNYPNPFNPFTTLRYDLPEDGFVNLTVYDMAGNKINQLVNEVQNSGFKSVQWNATNNRGQPISAGVYLYTILAGDFRQTKKMIFLK
tara:strand:+ start:167 stop:1453 length:1287 start_codon:yes stop_codon:yes gene_type:complete